MIQSYDPSTGGFQWSRSLDWLIYSSPILANGVVYANTLSSLYTLNAGNGAILWRGSVPADTGAAPVGVDAILYMVCSDGKLYAFSVNGAAPSSARSGQLGIKPAISSWKPDYSLRPQS